MEEIIDALAPPPERTPPPEDVAPKPTRALVGGVLKSELSEAERLLRLPAEHAARRQAGC